MRYKENKSNNNQSKFSITPFSINTKRCFYVSEILNLTALTEDYIITEQYSKQTLIHMIENIF